MAFTSETAKALGARGGARTVELHGREHMAEIGKLGMAALYAKLTEAAGADERARANVIVWITNMVHKKRRRSVRAKMIAERGYWNRDGGPKRRRDPMDVEVPF